MSHYLHQLIWFLVSSKNGQTLFSFLLQWTHKHTHIHTLLCTHTFCTHTLKHIHIHTKHIRIGNHTLTHTHTNTYICVHSIFLCDTIKTKKWKWEILKLIRSFVLVKLLAEHITFISGFFATICRPLTIVEMTNYIIS